MERTSRGAVSVEQFRNRVRLRWRYQTERLTMTIGDANSKVAWTVARQLAQQIEADLLTGNYDETRAKYRPDGHKADELLVVNLFASFQLARDMLEDSKYKALARKLKRLPLGRKDANRVSQTDAEAFIAGLNVAISTQRSYLTILQACWDFGCERKGLKRNPWEGVFLARAEPKRADPFEQQEVEQILQAFAGSYYLNWVKGLFSVGCRPGELSALTWADVQLEQRRVLINKAWNSQKRILKTTKTSKIRVTPIPSSLARLLTAIKPEDAAPTDLVFPSPEGVFQDVHNFLNRHWKPTLQKLGIRYRPQYNTRHTVWSHAIAGSEDVPPMPIAEAAKYAGNRPETMMRHYLGAVTQSEMPDLIGEPPPSSNSTDEEEGGV
jgi:integrase